MKPLVFALVVACFVLSGPDASAYYDAQTGRFLSRDPGPGGAARVGTAAPAPSGRVFQRDLGGQYTDGMNLYEYVRSSPLGYVDWSGWGATRPDGPAAPTSTPATQGVPRPGTIAAVVLGYALAQGHQAKINVAIGAANEIFAQCLIKVKLQRFESMLQVLTRAKLARQFLAALQGKSKDQVFTLVAQMGAAMAKQRGAHLGVVALDTNLVATSVGFSLTDAANSNYDAATRIRTIKPGGFIGGIVLMTRTMTVLTLAQEVRDRLASEDVDAKGTKLRHDNTADLIRGQPGTKLSTLCDDECGKLRAGLTRLGVIRAKPAPNAWYTVRLYVAFLPLNVHIQAPGTRAAPGTTSRQ